MIGHAFSLDWLLARLESGEPVRYLPFWGHTPPADGSVSKACFSQWFVAPFVVDGIVYPTAEHWMMAQKAFLFHDPQVAAKIIAASTPGEAKKLGREVRGFDDIRWNRKRTEIVRTGNFHKFSQHLVLRNFLLNTGDAVLVEASPVDAIWGIGLPPDHADVYHPWDWRGLNLLGFALMEVRELLREYGAYTGELPALLPPWKVFPGIHPVDMFWRMGKGEDFLDRYWRQWELLTEWEQCLLLMNFPAPPEWEGAG